KKMLKMIGVPADIVRRIAIGTYEAEMNVIIHAGGGNVAAEAFSDATVITVSDKGPCIPDIEKALQEGWSTAPDHVRQMGFGAGMGLPNMVKCSDKFDIQSVVGEGTTITMRFEHISEDL
ncbi:MAG: ATP-binding protein, partial [Phascolarctobacterium sp.]|nr:ATP-binding protein [Phascolarctobacterium sp.]